MTRFYPFESNGSKMQLRPVGLRKHWPLHMLPYRTGDELILQLRTIEAAERISEPEIAWYLVLVSPPTSVEREVSGITTRHKDLGVPVTFGRVPLSGEYQVDVVYERLRPTGKEGPEAVDSQYVSRENIATIQFIEDWKLMWNPFLIVVGSALGALGLWLFQTLINKLSG